MEGSVIVLVAVLVATAALVIAAEAARWYLRPEGRRLRMIRKIGKQQR
jgi:hypothetical protein